MTLLAASAPERNLFISSAPSLNGILKIQGFGDQFQEIKEEYLDHLNTFKNWFKIMDFNQKLDQMGMSTYFDVPGNIQYHNLKTFASTDFYCNSPWLQNHQLYRFQHTGLNYVYNLLTTDKSPRILIEWSPGAGKTVLANMVSQKLFDEGRVDLVICFCKRIKQPDWVEAFQNDTSLSVAHVSGTRQKRHKILETTDAQVLVMNYEKARFPTKKGRGKNISWDWSRTDLEQLMRLTAGKRILIICDEAAKINHSTSQISQGLNALFNNNVADIKPAWCAGLGMTATPYSVSPLNLNSIFSILVPGLTDVSLSKRQFEEMYMDQAWGRGLDGEVRKWDMEKVYLLGKKYSHHSNIVSKIDPDIAKQFPPSIEKSTPLELSEQDRRLYEALQEEINSDRDWNTVKMKSTAALMRSVCNTSDAVLTSNSKFCQNVKHLVGGTAQGNKFQYILSMVKDILDNNEKVVLFTFWTNNTLFPYEEELRKELGHSSPFFVMHGDMSDESIKSSYAKFNEAKGGAVLLSSDVGQDGLNFYAQNLIHIETPSTQSAYSQRSERISRSDSFENGIWTNMIHRFLTCDTIEVPNEKIRLNRRSEEGALRGDQESIDTLKQLLSI